MKRFALVFLAACQHAAQPLPPTEIAAAPPSGPRIHLRPRPPLTESTPVNLPVELELTWPSERPHFAIAEAYGVSLYTDACDAPQGPRPLEVAQYLHGWCEVASDRRIEGLEALGNLVGAHTPLLDAAVRTDLVDLAAITLSASDALGLLHRHAASTPESRTALAERYRALGRGDDALEILRDSDPRDEHDVCVRDARILTIGLRDRAERTHYQDELELYGKHIPVCKPLLTALACPLLTPAGPDRRDVDTVESRCRAYFPDADLTAVVLASRWPSDDANTEQWLYYASTGPDVMQSDTAELLVTALENAVLSSGCELAHIASHARGLEQRLATPTPELVARLDHLEHLSRRACSADRLVAREAR